MLETLLNGRYRIIRVLGSGGFGQTYVAEDIQQAGHPQCVVKQFKPAKQDVEFLKIARRLFTSEAATLSKLGSHPQIPALVDTFEENQEFYLVQEYIRGQTLQDELNQVKRLDEATVVAMLRDVLQILEFVHQNQVIHRDIKPANLMRREQDGSFVLIDFGAVKEIQTQLTSLEPGQTNLTVGIGTHGYVPSEQLIGKPRYNSDIYALGMTAIQALTGLQPYQLPTHADTAEVIWRDRVAIAPQLEAVLTRMTRYHFNQRYQSAGDVLWALEQSLETVLVQLSPGVASPVTVAPPDNTLIPPTLAGQLADSPHLGDATISLANVADKAPSRRFLAPLSVGVASLIATGLLVGVRSLGGLQVAELTIFDRMVQWQPQRSADPRLLVVGATEADLQKYKQFPLSDRVVAQAVQALQPYQPRAIGLDLLRNNPREPGRAELLAALKAPNVVVITQLGNTELPPIPPPPNMPASQVGFNDLVLDEDGVVRRNLLFADAKTTTQYSFSLRLALLFLQTQGILPKPDDRDPNILRLGKSVFRPLEENAGGYENVDSRGYQVLLRYRTRNVAQQVSLSDVLEGRLKPEWVKDRIVLIGTTAPSAKDLFFTPYSSAEKDLPRMAGVMVHAQLVSQFLDAALDGGAQFWFWPEWGEGLWIVGWAIAGASLAWYVRHPLLLTGSGLVLITILGTASFGLFTQGGWVPVAAPVMATAIAGGIVVAYRAYYRE